MNIHEYQAKEILTKFGVAIPKGGIAYSPENAKDKATELGGDMWVVKAQIHSGARGKAGGIIVCKSHQEVLDAANTLLGKTLVTNQTGPGGLTVQRIYVEEASDIKKEYYLGLVFDRSTESIMVVASSEGGMSIEEIAKDKPESIIRVKIEAAVGMQSFQAREIAFALGLEAKAISRCAAAILGCYKAFTNSDATMVEINPLVLTGDDHILAVDCKMSFDDNLESQIGTESSTFSDNISNMSNQSSDEKADITQEENTSEIKIPDDQMLIYFPANSSRVLGKKTIKKLKNNSEITRGRNKAIPPEVAITSLCAPLDVGIAITSFDLIRA